MSKRTDCHRPGAIVPSDYEHMWSYSLPGSGECPEPAWGLVEARELWLPGGSLPRSERFGTLGQCGVCGAHFRHGDIFRHAPTGHLISMGQDCSAKYEMVADRADWSAALEMLKRNRAAAIESMMRDSRLASFFAANPDLRGVFAIEHEIIQDMVQKIRRFGDLSEKQIAFATKLALAAWCPAKPEEAKVAAPVGRTSVRGRIVSIKCHEGYYGDTIKMTVKVTTEAGVWLAWGTMPSSLDAKKGDEIEFTGTLEAGNEPHFAFFKRPSKARVVSRLNDSNTQTA